MKYKKTRQENRSSYIYKFQCGDGEIIESYELTTDEVSEETIKLLHAMDDSEVYSNCKNGKPKPNDDWHLSLDCVLHNGVKSEKDGSTMSLYDMLPENYEVHLEDDIEEMLEKVTMLQRQVITFVGLYGYTMRETANILGISLSKTYRTYQAGINKLKKIYE